MLVSGLADHPPRRTANCGKPAWSCRSDFWERDLKGRAPSKGMVSAIDLVAGVKKVVVVMEHASKNRHAGASSRCRKITLRILRPGPRPLLRVTRYSPL